MGEAGTGQHQIGPPEKRPAIVLMVESWTGADAGRQASAGSKPAAAKGARVCLFYDAGGALCDTHARRSARQAQQVITSKRGKLPLHQAAAVLRL